MIPDVPFWTYGALVAFYATLTPRLSEIRPATERLSEPERTPFLALSRRRTRSRPLLVAELSRAEDPSVGDDLCVEKTTGTAPTNFAGFARRTAAAWAGDKGR
jgi:hypothetical protein